MAPSRKPGAVMGRRRLKAPPDIEAVILDAASRGAYSERSIAAALGVHRSVLQRWLQERPELQEFVDRGRERERQTLHSVLYERAIDPNSGRDGIIAAIFLLKARHGYIEGEPMQQGNRVNVTFNIPAALPMDKFMVIENAAEPRTEPVSSALTKRS